MKSQYPVGVWVNEGVNYARPSTVNGNVPVTGIVACFLEPGATIENVARIKGIRISDVLLALRFYTTYGRTPSLKAALVKKGIKRLAI